MQVAILHDGMIIPTINIDFWGKWMRDNERKIAFNTINGSEISTIFLGMNQGTKLNPKWFETLIFGGKFDQVLTRYETLDEALDGHRKACLLISGLKESDK